MTNQLCSDKLQKRKTRAIKRKSVKANSQMSDTTVPLEWPYVLVPGHVKCLRIQGKKARDGLHYQGFFFMFLNYDYDGTVTRTRFGFCPDDCGSVFGLLVKPGCNGLHFDNAILDSVCVDINADERTNFLKLDYSKIQCSIYSCTLPGNDHNG